MSAGAKWRFNRGFWTGLAVIAAIAVSWPDAVYAQGSQRTTPEPVPGGFRVCNKTSGEIEVAKAVNTSESGQTPKFISEGWYKFAPGECATLWSGKLQYRYYLLYGQNKQAGREWKGNIQVCVSSQPFTIQHGYCEQGNYHRGFFQVDTKDYESWTQNFTN